MSSARRDFLRTLVATGTGAGVAAVTTGTAVARERKQPAPDAVAMLYDATRCIGCKACVSKCKEVNKLPPDTQTLGPLYDAPADLSACTKNVIRLAKDGGKTSFMKSQCMHCVDPACVSACMLGAMHKGAGGAVLWDGSKCIGCRYCQVACPFDVPKMQWASATPRLVKCELCPERRAEGKVPGCVEACPREAIVFGKRELLLAEGKRRLSQHPDRYQPKIYGEHDGGGTQVLYMSSIPFDKLGLPTLGDESMNDLHETIQHSIYRGFIAPAALYAALGVVAWRNRRSGAEDDEKEDES